MKNNLIETNNFWIYGLHAVRTFLQVCPEDVAVLYWARQQHDPIWLEITNIATNHKINLKIVSARELEALLPQVNHQGIALQRKPSSVAAYSEVNLEALLENLQEPPFLLLLDGVQDPHNLGACLRTANAAGVHAVIAPRDKAVGITPAVRKVASGAAEITPFIQVTNLARTMEMLKERGIWLYGTLPEGEKSIYDTDLSGPMAFVLGAEGQGLRRLTRDLCDFLVNIPMAGTVGSLNVSVATGVCLFEARRQKCHVISR
ncbi:MAG: 23S rRNA (guanosine(2251)-2'-O)-methyltransferase RlmB [Gammaproteobacteria bacterium]